MFKVFLFNLYVDKEVSNSFLSDNVNELYK